MFEDISNLADSTSELDRTSHLRRPVGFGKVLNDRGGTVPAAECF